MLVNNRKYCIVGTGGFGRETLLCLIEMLSQREQSIEDTVVFMVSDEYHTDAKIMGVPVIKQSEFNAQEYQVVVAIGDPHDRREMVNLLPKETSYASIIHPQAIISDWVRLGKGAIVTAGVILTCNIQIGDHAQINLNTTVGHDCTIGDYFTSAPGVNISGNCTFGEQVYFGTSASVREGISICDNVTVGMGAVVVKNIAEKGTHIGNPSRLL